MTTNLAAQPDSRSAPNPLTPPPNPREEQRQKLFQVLFDLFRDTLKKSWRRSELQQHPLGKRLLRLARATYEQRSHYPLTWRQQFVRQARTLHSLTGYRDIRMLLFDWLKRMEELPADADLFVSSEPALRRHLHRLAGITAAAPALPAVSAPSDDAPAVVLTVDNPETHDRDDALSYRRTPEGEEIGVHVPDLTAFVPAGSTWDAWAAELGASAYLPHRTINMLPEAVNQAAGLQADHTRAVLSFYFTRTAGGAFRVNRIMRESLAVNRNADYEEIEMWLEVGAPGPWNSALQAWLAGAQQLEAARVAAGGRIFAREQIDVLLDASGRVELRRYAQNSAARKMIAEWMIAANAAAADFCTEHDLPCLYRTQERTSPAEEEAGMESEPRFARPQLSVQRAPHHDLGLPAYTQITSPLRRYVDLLMQRQLIAFLQTGTPCYSTVTLRGLAQMQDSLNQRLQRLQARAEFYYKCVYLAQHLGTPWKAEIHHSPAPSRSLVLRLPEIGLRLFLPQSSIKGLGMRQIPPYGAAMPVLATCLEMDPDRAVMVFQVRKTVPER
ncbi:MAG: ribonuclease catalytic domain-containing protein [candidate division KSB1 bacterium]|nr:ribonuclease catalytic domain-containing protein [candidate division KSB1 bacterium]MDZ7276496.1 ribonuclease catalytic domain-containing protein [candidate division KSB1 bacterium]MDZ7286723.1 ribonuclease catalytic domain-containing protein [candidate division KSB1 bacterium]MDZ7300266.1 ribonuclease catalytic domain-containing protein [candidate division KSB1 bacterium]MDZ7308579.1 ribonuclease catalytic domain-containing protein [candidate division KSB1 bacterium]